ncbi:uncharacterized protein LOC108905658 [Anoplophora glabripennis]|uniref:uncharacterized protein LOC108905658 n=1 Tax=Anoplophora glabripennis TaxID=217634 RepID=UPI0008753DF4|nr:uncharacterized protein LOC108905658 [Anoplophora glabripennis]
MLLWFFKCMRIKMFPSLFIFFSCAFVLTQCQMDLAEHFKDCHVSGPDFDTCIKDGLNDLRPFFNEGLPDYEILPFDPFFAPEVPQKRSLPFFNYKLLLKNVTESGWTASQVTRFKTDFSKNQIQVTQFFPDKKLDGWYEIEGSFFGRKFQNQGSWKLSLFDYIQTLTVVRKSVKDSDGYEKENPQIKVKCSIQSCKKLGLHIDHLAGGLTIVENILDRIINNAWQPGFVVLSPLINDLVGTAFTEIFNKNFQHFPFERIFHN